MGTPCRRAVGQHRRPLDVVLGHLFYVGQTTLEIQGVMIAADTEAIDERTPDALKQVFEVRVWLLLLHLSLTWGRLHRRGTSRTGRGP